MNRSKSIKVRKDQLRKLSKEELIRRYPSRLDMSCLKSEPKSIIINGILEAEFGRRALSEWNGK